MTKHEQQSIKTGRRKLKGVNKMTKKEEVFPLYVGRCKVMDKEGGVHVYTGIDDIGDRIETTIFPTCHKISDCQLILKRISGMGVEQMKEVEEIGHALIQEVDDFKVMSKCAEIGVWLIKNGYALSDEWFDNGIAVEQAEEKK